jgi:hypothetical protein
MNYNNDLPGVKQVTKGDKKKQQLLYIIWIIPLCPRLENLMKWMWLIPSWECRPNKYVYKIK